MPSILGACTRPLDTFLESRGANHKNVKLDRYFHSSFKFLIHLSSDLNFYNLWNAVWFYTPSIVYWLFCWTSFSILCSLWEEWNGMRNSRNFATLPAAVSHHLFCTVLKNSEMKLCWTVPFFFWWTEGHSELFFYSPNERLQFPKLHVFL